MHSELLDVSFNKGKGFKKRTEEQQ